MAANLVIVESPAKAKTIRKFLGKNYEVMASKGHVRDLPKSSFGVDLERGFQPKYITIRGKGDIIQELKKAAKKANRVLLATDPDREGEAISWHLAKTLDLQIEEPCRVEFNEITKDAIQEAIKKPRTINLDRVNAQQARRILDRIVGYKLSPLLWRKVRKGLSAGRVQSVAVRLICDREDEIRNFKPEEYWSITAKLAKEGAKETFYAKLIAVGKDKAEINNEASAIEIVNDISNFPFLVDSIKSSERRRQPAAPFTTSSLQQEAARKLGFTSKKTMSVAQQLYEGLDLGKLGTVGLISYIRTDSTRISDQARQEAKEYILQKYGKEYYPAKPNVYVTKQKSQDAHEAIRPTNVGRLPEMVKEFLTNDQYKLYKLIWERFVASQMNAAVYDTKTVDIKTGPYTFRATGSTIKFPGFMVLYIEGDDEEEKETENILPEMNTGEKLRLIHLEPKQHFTQPPPRYTEAMLVKTLEEKEIGRPSTYAPIIDTIIKRGYVTKVQKRFIPTELGEVVVQMLKEFFPEIINVEFTASMEDKLDLVAEGKENWQHLLSEFYEPFSRRLEQADRKIEAIEIPDPITEEICEKCGKNMVIKHGRFGEFLACPGYPECKNTKPLLKETGVLCPLCNGKIVERKSKRGRIFYGCTSYPECQFVLWEKPLNKKCPKCGSFLVEKKEKGSIAYCCFNKDCTYSEKKADREEH